MSKKYQGITSYEKLSKSPFIDELMEIEVSARRKIFAGKEPSSMMIDTKTGEVKAHQVFAVQEKVDKATYTKMFSGMMRELFKLSPRGVKVFGYITTIAKPNKDVVMFDMEEAQEYTGYKKEQSILHGIEELLKENLIARTKKHYKYYINPNLFFNGSRLTLIRQYIKDERLSPIDNIKKLPPSGNL